MSSNVEYRKSTKLYSHKELPVDSEFRNIYNDLKKLDMGTFRFLYERDSSGTEDLVLQIYDRNEKDYVSVVRFDSDGTIHSVVDPASAYVTEDSHEALRQLIHFIDEGPAEGFLTGAYKVVTGTMFPTAIVWYNDNTASKKKIVEKLMTWVGVVPTVITWKLYDSSEVLLHTVTDTISYTGIFETSRLRAIV